MEIVKVLGIGIIGAVVVSLLKSAKSEFVIPSVIVTGLIILILLFNSLMPVISAFDEILDKTNVDSSIFACLLKIVGIGYVTEYSADVCKDCGAESIGNKLILCGKISIFLTSFPIINNVINLVLALI